MPIAAILSSAPSALLGPPHPDADPVLAPLAADVHGVERADQPGLERRDETAQIRVAPLQVEHDIGHALARPVIGELPAAAAAMHREPARRHQILVRAEVPAV